MDSLVYINIFIRLKDPSDDTLRAEIIESFKTAIDDDAVAVIDQYEIA